MAYKMTHPDSKQEIEVDGDSVEAFETQGWKTAPNVKSPTEDDEPKKK